MWRLCVLRVIPSEPLEKQFRDWVHIHDSLGLTYWLPKSDDNICDIAIIAQVRRKRWLLLHLCLHHKVFFVRARLVGLKEQVI